jgi:very-short-patch-repair endonuclease
VIGDRFRGVDTSTLALLIECTLARGLSEAPDLGLAVSLLRSGKAAEILRALEDLSAARDSIETDATEVALTLDLDDTTDTAAALWKRLEDLRQAAANPSALMERGRLRKSEETLRQQGFASLVDWVRAEGAGFDPFRLGPIMRAIVAKSMADHAFDIHGNALQGYDGEDFDRIRAEIVEKDRELIAMSRDVVKNQLIANANPPAGNGIGRKSTFTDMSLIRNEMGKKRNRIGVRELTARAGDALLALKPCWMMSPLAVAQYLHAGLTFDLVVIDEASQMTPENAVGALSRARQAVVVGDTKQLPPTTFFQKMLDDSDTDEDLREDSESVLDMANMAFRPVRQLRWHYRSRHSALIRFSNTWMYDEKLTIFPSAQEDDPDLGVHIEEVDGIYKGRTNAIEARKVVQAVVAQMRDHPDLSLGVCTMNSDQKELIREEFEREFERNRHVQAYVRDWQERADALEEFFIKNLETIQGDERDVMFISTLYGPESSGARVHQRFGPINSVHGHRRLNVLFTRAKRKIVTFTSLKPSDILAGEEKARGVRMFRAWLEYCASGQVPDKAGSGGESESPFERYVAEQIEAMGFEAVAQVGAAGYRIDIGVRHPDWPYGYILGVECDGASYHSSKSSRDRDRLRQEVLEGLGWRFHRIWSTDWFNDPRSQIERLRDAIAAALDDAKAKPVVRRPIAVEREMRRAEPTGSEALEPGRRTASAQGGLFDSASAQATPNVPDAGRAMDGTPEMLANGIVGLGSRVKIESLSDNGRKLAFTIVSEGNDLENGKLGILTPLGQALIDAQEGDEVEYQVGVEIREVRVLEVVQPV